MGKLQTKYRLQQQIITRRIY